MNRVTRLLRGGILLLFLIGAPAGAEIYRCPGPDGEVLFTSDASQCPGQAAHRTTGQIQGMGSADGRRSIEGSPRSAAPVRRRRYDNSADEAAEALWRSRRREAEARLAQVSARLPGARKAAGWCNRGDNVYSTDDMGIRSDIPCKSLNEDLKDLEASHIRLTAYLDDGLEEECRRAGCLPGWIRE